MATDPHSSKTFENYLLRLRHFGHRGTVIPMHHALTRLRFGWSAKLSMILLPVLFDLMLWGSVNDLLSLWNSIFLFWTDMLDMNANMISVPLDFLGQTLQMPVPDFGAAIPDARTVDINLIVCVVAFLVTLLFPQSITPLTYLIRTALVIQASASVYFLIMPHYFPYTLQSYISLELTVGLCIMFLLSPILAFIYYIFDFSVLRKCMLTILILLFFSVAIPFQYMMQAYIIAHGTLLFMPILYLLFGLLLDVLIFIAFYSLGMSWHAKKKDDLGRYA